MSTIEQAPPYQIGERVAPATLMGWNYSGLSGTPDKPNAVRRYIKGMWVMELTAWTNKRKPAKVISVRTESEDKQWWADQKR